MQKKIYVVGMFDDGTAGKVQAAVSAVAGVTNCVAAINAAISGCGVDVIG